jgi:undecaprenyl diphosphate synthase
MTGAPAHASQPNPIGEPSASHGTGTQPSMPAGLQKERLPRHIAVIMDGNGRWALGRGLPRVMGHRQGAESVRRIVTECARLGVEALTLYSFSSENWKRPAEEIDALMLLCEEYLASQRRELLDHGIRFRTIGRVGDLPESVRTALAETTDAAAGGTRMTLVLALNYGSRQEITDAVRSIAGKVRSGDLDPESIDEATVAAHLDTAGLPDPDLLIRTAGELRISNYLLWQISYAEIHVTDVLWPEFTESDLHRALHDFAGRNRTRGGLEHSAKEGSADPGTRIGAV